MAYQVGIDMGATWTAAAVCRAGGGAEPAALGEHARAVPTVAHAGPDGAFSTGETAERRAAADPRSAVRGIPARVGDPTPVLLGREPVLGEALAARIVAAAVRHVARREGGPPEHVAVVHPAGWGAHKTGALRAALAGHGVGPASLVPGPLAAVAGAGAVVPHDAVVVVVDLGGTTCDTAVVRGGALLAAGDVVPVGGAVLDEAVFAHVREALGAGWEGLDGEDPAVLTAVARLRRDCTTAREVLSDDTVAQVPVMLPGLHTTVRIGRAEFEDAIRPALVDVVDAAVRTAAAAGAAPGALLLVGGAARTPLVVEALSSALGLPALPLPDPGGVVVAGAALLARAAAGGPVRVDRRGPVGPSVAAAGAAAAGGAAAGGAVAGSAAARSAAGAAGAGPTGTAGLAAASRDAGAAPTRIVAPPRPASPSRPGGPADEEVARPPRRPGRFAGPSPAARRGRAVLAGVVGSAVALGAIGVAIALAGQGAPGAAATTPPAVSAVPSAVVEPLSVPPTTTEPEPEPQAPPPRTAAPPPRTTTTAPRTTTAPPTTTTTTTTPAPPTTDPTTAPDEPEPVGGGGAGGSTDAAASGAAPAAAAATGAS
jgi:actin-like ATPase involved in cell morphogenesis